MLLGQYHSLLWEAFDYFRIPGSIKSQVKVTVWTFNFVLLRQSTQQGGNSYYLQQVANSHTSDVTLTLSASISRTHLPTTKVTPKTKNIRC